ncbi:unnamed protein product, partial [Mesorhabditis belari]|uniref:C-type lectin domain-containing protein n=1 Tax=Mesorhabditis belari TaxID=2138241 RepID=A0AAF3EL14_9BILA
MIRKWVLIFGIFYSWTVLASNEPDSEASNEDQNAPLLTCQRKIAKLQSTIKEQEARIETLEKERKEMIKELPCSLGWKHFNGFCYKRFSNRDTYDKAIEICEIENSRLASIHSVEENKIVLGDLQWGWIGLEHNGTNWNWSDGSPFDYANWDNGQPNNLPDEKWVRLSSWLNGKWRNEVKSLVGSPVCKKARK